EIVELVHKYRMITRGREASLSPGGERRAAQKSARGAKDGGTPREPFRDRCLGPEMIRRHPGAGTKCAATARQPRLSAFHGFSAAAPARHSVARTGRCATRAEV